MENQYETDESQDESASQSSVLDRLKRIAPSGGQVMGQKNPNKLYSYADEYLNDTGETPSRRLDMHPGFLGVAELPSDVPSAASYEPDIHRGVDIDALLKFQRPPRRASTDQDTSAKNEAADEGGKSHPSSESATKTPAVPGSGGDEGDVSTGYGLPYLVSRFTEEMRTSRTGKPRDYSAAQHILNLRAQSEQAPILAEQRRRADEDRLMKQKLDAARLLVEQKRLEAAGAPKRMTGDLSFNEYQKLTPDEKRDYDRFRGRKPAGAAGDAVGKMSGKGLSDDALKGIADYVQTTGNLPPGLSRAGLLGPVLESVFGGGKGEGVAQSSALFKGQKDVVAKNLLRNATIDTLQETLSNHLQTMLDNASEVAKNASTMGIPALDEYTISAQAKLGDKAAAALIESNLAARSEYARLISISTTGSGQPTIAMQKEAEKALPLGMNPDQIKRTMDQVSRLASQTKQAGEKTVRGGLGGMSRQEIQSSTAESANTAPKTTRKVGDIITGKNGKKYKIISLEGEGQVEEVQ